MDFSTVKKISWLGGFNEWDEEWEVGSYDGTTGEPVVYSDRIRAKNKYKCFPNTTYFFKTKQGLTSGNVYYYDENTNFIRVENNLGNKTFTAPSNAHYMTFTFGLAYGSTYNRDICINKSQPDTSISPHNGDYVPYMISVKQIAVNDSIIWKSTRLPSEYQEVEYLESTGTQWIDSGVAPIRGNITRIESHIRFNATNGLLGVYGGQYFGVYQSYGASDSTFTNSTGNSGAIPYDTEKHLFVSESNNVDSQTGNNKLYVDGILSMSSTRAYTISNICIGNLDYSASPTMFACKANFYDFKIYDNGQLVRHFIPCFRKTDYKPGMYDIVNNVFYTNQGTGEFLLGKRGNSYSGVVDLGRLTDWIESGKGPGFYYNIVTNTYPYKPIENTPMYTSRYTYKGTSSSSPYWDDNDKTIKAFYNGSQTIKEIYIHDSLITSAQQIPQFLSEVYLFYQKR